MMWSSLLAVVALISSTNAAASLANSDEAQRLAHTTEEFDTSTRLLAVDNVDAGKRYELSELESTLAADNNPAKDEQRRLTPVSLRGWTTQGISNVKSGGKWVGDKVNQLAKKLGSYVSPSTRERINKPILKTSSWIRDKYQGLKVPAANKKEALKEMYATSTQAVAKGASSVKSSMINGLTKVRSGAQIAHAWGTSKYNSIRSPKSAAITKPIKDE